jgi:cytochrome P450
MDLIAEYANPLPVRVIGDLIGVPKTDQLWVAEQTAALNQVLGFLPLEDAVAQHANAAIAGLCDYFGDLADNKRAWLAVHPNTVAYRLRRAAELLGHDLNRRAAEVEVALTIAPLLGHQSLD